MKEILSSRLQQRRIKLVCSTPAMIKSLVVALLFLFTFLPRPLMAAPGTWSPTGSLDGPRDFHIATLLPSGRVLVAAGLNESHNPLVSAMLFNPETGSFALTGAMGAGRERPCATLLPSGKVLISGGRFSDPGFNAELYDEVSGTWSPTASMNTDRFLHTATLLSDGKVLVAGGSNLSSSGALASAELYEPNSGSWSLTGSMITKRYCHSATLLPDGQVIAIGGENDAAGKLKSTKLYNPISKDWTTAGEMLAARSVHTATLLPNGKVLVAGGNGASGMLAGAELYDPSSNSFTPTGSMHRARSNHVATLLPGGKVLVSGGAVDPDAELYDPDTGTWSLTGSLATNRYFHTATLLDSGRVLVTGGYSAYPLYKAIATCEIYDPLPPPQISLPAPLAFFPFDGNAGDFSGNGRHGTIHGSPTEAPGYQGKAFLFNGVSDFISIPLDINPSQYPRLTMGAWAKPMFNGNIRTLLTHDNGSYDRQIGLDTRGGGIGWSAFSGPGGGVFGAVPAVLRKWTFVAVVYDQNAQTVKLQVDDMVLTKSVVTLGEGQNLVDIGGSPLFTDYFCGFIDNVFIFGDALSDEQLAYIRTQGVRAFLKPSLDPLLLLLGD